MLTRTVAPIIWFFERRKITHRQKTKMKLLSLDGIKRRINIQPVSMQLIHSMNWQSLYLIYIICILSIYFWLFSFIIHLHIYIYIDRYWAFLSLYKSIIIIHIETFFFIQLICVFQLRKNKNNQLLIDYYRLTTFTSNDELILILPDHMRAIITSIKNKNSFECENNNNEKTCKSNEMIYCIYRFFLPGSNRINLYVLEIQASFYVAAVAYRNDVVALNLVWIDLFDCHTNRQLQNYYYCLHYSCHRLYFDRLYRNSSNNPNMVDVNVMLPNWLGNLEYPVSKQKNNNQITNFTQL